MAVDLSWTSGHTSSTDITILSILFLVVFVALYTLCTTCFSEIPESPEEKEKPSPSSLSVNREDQRSRNSNEVLDAVLSSTPHSEEPHSSTGPQYQNHNVVYNQQTHFNFDRDKLDSYFRQEMTPRIPDTPKFSLRSTGSASSELPALPPIPPIFNFNTLQLEPRTVSPSSFSFSSGQQDKTVWECVTPPAEDISSVFTETVSEEHPYECIDTLRVSGPSSPSFCDEADEEQWESESPYHMVTEWTETADDYDLSTLLSGTDSENELKFIYPAVPDGRLNPDRTVLYAEVNWKNKNRRSTDEDPIEQDNGGLDEEEAPPPVPEKIFD